MTPYDDPADRFLLAVAYLLVLMAGFGVGLILSWAF